MSVENFFPEHYPWQRLLSDIHDKLVSEDDDDGDESEDDMIIELVMGQDGDGNTTYELQITCAELLEALETKHVVAVCVDSEYGNVYAYPVLFGGIIADPEGYSFNILDYNGGSYYLSGTNATDKPLYTESL